MPTDAPHIVVFCPLAHEGGVIARHLHKQRSVVSDVVILGTDPDRIRRTLRDRARDIPATGPRLFLLAGLAGGLAPCPPCPFVSAVIDADTGASWRPSPPADAPAATLLGSPRPLLTTEEKRRWHERTGASIVDTESHVFAAACEELGVPWGVVRGVSDSYDECLPKAATNWIDDRGRTRLGRICQDAVLHPGLIPVLIRLGRRSNQALPLVARRIDEIARAGSQVEVTHG